VEHLKSWLWVQFLFIRGRWRIWWGFCPACNSDAPQLYDCTVCHYYSGGYPPSRMRRAIWWVRFRRWVYVPTGYVKMLLWMRDLRR